VGSKSHPGHPGPQPYQGGNRRLLQGETREEAREEAREETREVTPEIKEQFYGTFLKTGIKDTINQTLGFLIDIIPDNIQNDYKSMAMDILNEKNYTKSFYEQILGKVTSDNVKEMIA